MSYSRNNSPKQPSVDDMKLVIKKTQSKDIQIPIEIENVNAQPSPPISSDLVSFLSPRVYGVYESFSDKSVVASLEQKLDSSLFYDFNAFSSLTIHSEKQKEDEFKIDVSQKIYFTQKDQIYDVNNYLNSYVFTAKGQIFIVNKLGKIIPKTNVEHAEVIKAIDSMTSKYSLLSPYFPLLIQFFTSLSTETSLLIKNYLTIDEEIPLNEQLTPYELKKFTILISDRFSRMAEKEMGVDINSDSLERIFFAADTGIPEPGPYYERKTGKGITALNIGFYKINVALQKPLEKKIENETQENKTQAETLFMAYNKRFNTEIITRENLDLLINELPSHISDWAAFKQFYHNANMIYLDAAQRHLCELQFTSVGLATVSPDHPHKLFNENQSPINGRMLADTAKKPDNHHEIHGANTAIYVFHQGKILIARDKLAQFHHSSFANHGVECAGTLRISNEGKILMISNESGHYRPSTKRFHKVLLYLIKQNAFIFLEELKITSRTLIKDKGEIIGTGIRTEILKNQQEIQDYLKNISSLQEQPFKNQLLSSLTKARTSIKNRYSENNFSIAMNDIHGSENAFFITIDRTPRSKNTFSTEIINSPDSKNTFFTPIDNTPRAKNIFSTETNNSPDSKNIFGNDTLDSKNITDPENNFVTALNEMPGLEYYDDKFYDYKSHRPPPLELATLIKLHIEPTTASSLNSSDSSLSSRHTGKSPSLSSNTESPNISQESPGLFAKTYPKSNHHTKSLSRLASVMEDINTHIPMSDEEINRIPMLEKIDYSKNTSKKSIFQLFKRHFKFPFKKSNEKTISSVKNGFRDY